MSFEMTRGMVKVDDWLDMQVTDAAIELIEGHYDTEYGNLSPDQIAEVSKFADDNPWMVLSYGLRNVVVLWENQQEY